jgi:16S rRNA (cytosine1402-N4)-methyltransferase
LIAVEAPFGALDAVAEKESFGPVDGVVLDIGVSSMQLDEPERGFSFQADGPLDMRMSRHGATAADVVNGTDEETLARIIYVLGEERRSRAIARAIVAARGEAPLQTTKALADLVARVLGGRKIDGRHPATRTFQALRIYVNDELGELARGLGAAERCLKPGGRLVVVTFHSLEDRIVKRFLAERAGKEARGSRHLPEQSIKSERPSFRIVNPRPLTPSKGELQVNPRARSARARVAVRTEAPAWPLDAILAGLPSVSS